MTSPKKVSILCRYGGNLYRESGKISYEGGTNRKIQLGAQEINYRNLLSKLVEVCKWSQVGSIKYKDPNLGLDYLVSIENDEDLCYMMQAFEKENGWIHLFIFEHQETLSIRNTIPSDKEIMKATDENHRGHKKMLLQPNSNVYVKVEPTDTLLPPKMEPEEGQEMPLQPHVNTAGDTLPMELEEGKEFPDENILHKFLRQYAIHKNFEYKRTRSGHGRFAAKCVKKDCPWKIQALRLSNQSIKIKSLKGKHTCDLDKKRTSHRQATMRWIADIVEDANYFERDPKFITEMIGKKYGFNVDYHKVWRGIRLACKERNSIGNSGQGYGSDLNVDKLCEDIRRTNPRSRVKLQSKLTDNNCLKLFISYEAAVFSIFRMACRPVVRLSCVQVECDRPFVWLMATGLDTNGECLFLACGFIELDEEEEEEEEEDLLQDYKWFCEELFHILGQIRNLVIVVDYTPNGGVLEVVRSIFRCSHCRYDPSSFTREMGWKFRTLETKLLSDAMGAFKRPTFGKQMSKIQRQCPEAWNFLRNVNREYWATSHFKGDLGVGISFNPLWLPNECGVKTVRSIVELVEHLHNLMMGTFTERAKRSSNWTSILLPRFEDAYSLDPFPNLKISKSTTPTRFTVSSSEDDHSVQVDIHMRKCSCDEWQIYGHPCGHARQVIKDLGQNIYEYWDDCYKTHVYREAYSLAVIHPLNASK